jgi:hypothetical protein
MKAFFYIAWLMLAAWPASTDFQSFRPTLGHEASMDLHSFCNGDPLNSFDPTGCFGKSVNDFLGSGVGQTQDQIGALTDQFYAENGYGHSPNGDEMISGFYNALPLIGAAKMMIELGTGSDLVTGRTIEGSGVGQAAGILFNVLGVALPMMEVGAGAIGAGSELAAGSIGTESIVADTELAANTTATQMEFNFVDEDLSGRLSSVEGVETTEAADSGTLTFYRGTTYYDALETVQNGTFDAARLAQQQASASYSPGLYLTSQESTAGYYADLAGLQGRGGGPGMLQVTVPQSDFSALMQKYGIQYETDVVRPPWPGQTETLIPPSALDEFNAMMSVSHH